MNHPVYYVIIYDNRRSVVTRISIRYIRYAHVYRVYILLKTCNMCNACAKNSPRACGHAYRLTNPIKSDRNRHPTVGLHKNKRLFRCLPYYIAHHNILYIYLNLCTSLVKYMKRIMINDYVNSRNKSNFLLTLYNYMDFTQNLHLYPCM